MTEEELREAVLEIVREKYRISGGHNGTYLVELRDRTGADVEQIKPVLNALFKERKIRVSDGSKGKLILLRKKP